jgi:hypothetical protein
MANKTLPTAIAVADFLDAVEPQARRQEAVTLDALFRRATGYEPVMWGPTIVGYGRYHYRYASGREGFSLATGLSPRKAAISVYVLPGYADFGPILADLGPHSLGKSCLYIRRLAEVDLGVLERLIRAGLDDLGKRWTVMPR